MSAQEKEQETNPSTQYFNNESDNSPTELTQAPFLHNDNSYGNRDRLFLCASAIELISGIALVYIPILPLIPIVPSILIGSGIATFVYKFMGGIRQDDSLALGGIKIGGVLASLLGSAIIINNILDAQAGKVDIKVVNPLNEKEVFVVSRSNGKLLTLEIADRGRRSIPLILGTTSNPSINENPIKSSCLDGKGLCQDDFKPVKLIVDNTLKTREAGVCENHSYALSQIPMQIVADPNGTRLSLVSIGSRKYACSSKPNEPMQMYISPIDAKNIGVKVQNLSSNKQVVDGYAKIANLRGILFDYSP